MHFVLISICCSVAVAVLLKYARQCGVDTWQMIVWNYPAALAFTYFIFQPDLNTIAWSMLPWCTYLPIAVLLPGLFMLLSYSLRYAGLVQTEVAQRLSLVLSLLAAAFVFGEVFSAWRIAGILVGFLAIAFLVGWRKGVRQSQGLRYLLFPLLVFVGYGAIDVLFKTVALEIHVPYTTSLLLIFTGAFILAFMYFIVQCIFNKLHFSAKSVYWGLVLGALNFGNILFYMRAHQALVNNPSVVFAGMNIGVIGVGALLGVLLFKEKLSRVNVVGIALAIVAVLMIAYL